MDDKNFSRFMFGVMILFLVWWLFHKRNAGPETASGLPIMGSNDPEIATYSANPSKFGPQTINGAVNIAVNGYNGLNQNYMPLFGFVGMSQGEIYQ